MVSESCQPPARSFRSTKKPPPQVLGAVPEGDRSQRGRDSSSSSASTASSTDQQMRPQASIAPATKRFMPSPAAFPPPSLEAQVRDEADDAAVPPLVAFDELGEHPDLAGRAVVDARPVEPGEQHVRGAHALGVDAVHLGGVSSVSSPNCSCGTKHSNPSPRSLAASPSSHARSASEKRAPAT